MEPGDQSLSEVADVLHSRLKLLRELFKPSSVMIDGKRTNLQSIEALIATLFHNRTMPPAAVLLPTLQWLAIFGMRRDDKQSPRGVRV